MSDRTTEVFIDAVENGVARVLAGEQVFELPAALLPPGAGEGDWVAISIEGIPTPADRSGDLQRQLGADDDGGDIKL